MTLNEEQSPARGDASDSPAERAKPINGQSATQWLYEAGWGVWMHYLDHSLLNQYQPWGQEFQSHCTPESCRELATNPATLQIAVREWNQIVDGFDVNRLVRQLQELQAGFRWFLLFAERDVGFDHRLCRTRYQLLQPTRSGERIGR